MNEKLEMIYDRRSCRRYLDTPVDGEKVQVIQKAVTLSPSARNEQPWHVVFIEDQEIISQIEALAGRVGACYNAPLLMITFVQKENVIAPVTDGIFATANAMYACEAVGLSSCFIHCIQEVFNDPAYSALSEAVGVPTGYMAVASLAIGYAAEKSTQEPERKQNVFSYVGKGGRNER